MKKTKIYNQFFLSLFLLSTTLFSFSGCSDEDNKAEGTLELAEPIKVVGAKQGEVSIEVNSNTDWKIGKLEEGATWFSVSKAENQSTSFTIQYKENANIENRETEFYVVTVDGNGFQKFHFTQLGDAPALNLETESLEVSSRTRTHRVKLETNIPISVIEKEVIYKNGNEGSWIIGLDIEGDILKFKTERNLLDKEREASIILSFNDESGEDNDAWVELEIKQISMQNDVPPVVKDFNYAKSLPVGDIEENISIEGNIVMNQPSDNFRPGTKTYIIQDKNNSAIVFEAMEDLTFGAYDKVQLLLDGAEKTLYTENGFTYQVIKGITKGSIVTQTADQSFTPKEMYMKDLTDDYLLSLVTLKDVEFSIPFGGFTNINEGYLKDDHTKAYPHSIRDINGDYMYMLTNREVTYRKQSVPQGSGKLTGIIVRVNEICYGDIGQYSIRQLKREHVDFATSRSEGFSNILVEWDCLKPTNFVEGMTNIAPKIGSPSAILQKKNTPFATTSAFNPRVYFLAEYRGDKTGGTVSNGGYNALGWGTDEHWLIDKISTVGITNPISLQIEVNSSTSDGPRDYAVEYSLDGEKWILVENYIALGQISGSVKTSDVIPGFKMHNFNLPKEILGKENVKIRLRNTSMVRVDGTTNKLGTGRLVHLSMKYNK